MFDQVRRKIAVIIYPEVFRRCRGLQISSDEMLKTLKRAEEVIRGKGKMITMCSEPGHLREDSPIPFRQV